MTADLPVRFSNILVYYVPHTAHEKYLDYFAVRKVSARKVAAHVDNEGDLAAEVRKEEVGGKEM